MQYQINVDDILTSNNIEQFLELYNITGVKVNDDFKSALKKYSKKDDTVKKIFKEVELLLDTSLIKVSVSPLELYYSIVYDYETYNDSNYAYRRSRKDQILTKEYTYELLRIYFYDSNKELLERCKAFITNLFGIVYVIYDITSEKKRFIKLNKFWVQKILSHFLYLKSNIKYQLTNEYEEYLDVIFDIPSTHIQNWFVFATSGEIV